MNVIFNGILGIECEIIYNTDNVLYATTDENNWSSLPHNPFIVQTLRLNSLNSPILTGKLVAGFDRKANPELYYFKFYY